MTVVRITVVSAWGFNDDEFVDLLETLGSNVNVFYALMIGGKWGRSGSLHLEVSCILNR